MALGIRVALLLACLGAAPPLRPRVKVEFRWLEDRPVAGLTQQKGVRTSCAPAVGYPHARPALTNGDYADARVKQLLGGWSEVEFDLTAEARRRMAASKDRGKLLACFVDGRYFGAFFYRPSEGNYDVRVIFQARSDSERVAAGARPTPPE